MEPAPHEPGAAAGIVPRAAAYLIDGLVALVGAQLLQGAALALGTHPEWVHGGWEWSLYLLGTVTLPVLVAFAWMESSARQATLGKQALALRVVDQYGARIGFLRSLVRNAVKLLPLEVLQLVLCLPAPFWEEGGPPFVMRRAVFIVYGLLGLYLAAAMMTLKKQSVHDLVAGTCVVVVPRPAGG